MILIFQMSVAYRKVMAIFFHFLFMLFSLVLLVFLNYWGSIIDINFIKCEFFHLNIHLLDFFRHSY